MDQGSEFNNVNTKEHSNANTQDQMGVSVGGPDASLSGRFGSCPDFASLDALLLSSCINNMSTSELVAKINIDSGDANMSTPKELNSTEVGDMDWTEGFRSKSEDDTASAGYAQAAQERATNTLVHRHSSHNPTSDHFRKHNQSLQMYLNDTKAKQQRQPVHQNSVDSFGSYQGP
ncbi:hypothetical protein SARC_08328 [Sphaeroforma arctica JP610]|uniref:Uncharacterized protein n=1 Tax=Sphaeroforma arctica JP610 TaxID=667725 RepID=A0A0L0FRS7_9EUKA|nr:hypothetical protein SARC_08328 [Sphaeroforma arctica JP610]KNC79276.1 hypothetical protein SARC_08328 [Sphaeroforma arctica JP610]|eukprot:XP_014153178.1 hypothetical protein SARC_08328 [Sphaeroforma arctica JP610]